MAPRRHPVEKIWVGPAGWSYADWKGVCYPVARPSGWHELSYLAEYFDTVEINTSFYRPLRPEVSTVWLRKVAANPRFRFTAKLYHGFTHERNAGAAEEKQFREGITPLLEAGKLGALLLQFPWSFKNTPEQRKYLEQSLERFRGCPRVVEVRHSSWNQPEILSLLREHGAGFCNLDQPVIGHSMPATTNLTAPVGYVRLHGRNYETWFAEQVGVEERYDYLYSREELAEWKRRVERMAAQSEATYVILNNHYRAQAAANALQLISLLHQQAVAVPTPLLEHYPQLEECSSTPLPQPQLFRIR
ncbi:MAG: DUF72 domain-containing protein [Acidobacteria bacterium]|nr:DUF72 domain-containing protein [Acidobacteriota bacterium]